MSLFQNRLLELYFTPSEDQVGVGNNLIIFFFTTSLILSEKTASVFCLGAGAGAEAWLSLEKNLNLKTFISTASFFLELLWGSSGVMGAIGRGGKSQKCFWQPEDWA